MLKLAKVFKNTIVGNGVQALNRFLTLLDKAIANCQKKAKDLARDFPVDLTTSDSEDSLNDEEGQKESKKRASSSQAEVSEAKRTKLDARSKDTTRAKEFLASGLSMTDFYNLSTRPLESPPPMNPKDFYKRHGNLANKAQKRALQSLSMKSKPVQRPEVFSELLAAKIEQDKERKQLASLLSREEDA